MMLLKLVFAGLMCFVLIPQTARAESTPQKATIIIGDKGIQTLTYDGTDLLADGEFQVIGATLQTWDGRSVEASMAHEVVANRNANRVEWRFAWGTVTCLYRVSAQRVGFEITVANTSKHILRSIIIQPLVVKFPRPPRGWITHYPQLSPNVGAPAVNIADYGDGALAFCNDEIGRSLLTGFPGRESLSVRPIWISSANIGWLAPMLDSFIDRPIYPNQTDRYHVSLRFADTDSSLDDLAPDIKQAFVEANPPQLKWRDRRPIAALFLSSSEMNNPRNPRGWFNDRQADLISPAGQREFHERLLAYADQAVRITKSMNAQGMILWDVEGQEYPHATSYLGDPRSLPTEMQSVVDEFFKKFTDAGLHVGVCLRPQRPVRSTYDAGVFQIETPNAETTLSEKIDYAKKRWGCTLFYVDSNGDPNVPFSALIFKRLADKYPDILLVPEHENTNYYAHTAPYQSFFHHGIAATPDAVRDIYPQAFSVIYAADGDLDGRRKDLLAAVKRGDILMFNGWFDNPAQSKIKSIYEEAGKPS
ncbi:MAG: hypothetical protein MSG64_13120 [Pyrinomonadaceae bacterium MAG19_C2-C3]|nr:hypothetical protein [Pyrinomonadaceae bacterium MAG19_C2-C3]